MEVGNTAAAPTSPPSTSYGLKSGALSSSETLAQSVAVIAPTGAPVMTVPLVFGLAGEGCAIVYLIATVSILLVALNINQFARISASPGSLYTYITDHMHPRFGVVAGCLITEGVVKRNNPIRVLRENVVIFEGALESLRRFKDDVSEVRAGVECGIGVRNYQDVRAGDQIECFSRVEIARALE